MPYPTASQDTTTSPTPADQHSPEQRRPQTHLIVVLCIIMAILEAVMCGHTGCNRTPSGIISRLRSGHTVADTEMIGLLQYTAAMSCHETTEKQ
ncbi:hypothetical protein Q8A67_010295 [Cirrhinus molitorella]|uniref:Uncharacterized protein n=1 Tax=Cirrhinus molitorella TaxID=172907 RepID=A0AA88TS14_9TELE|nr:hypothetical protein Q8A67_010295 [Cirrhinus molitorella]